jgi:hypothetical protein
MEWERRGWQVSAGSHLSINALLIQRRQMKQDGTGSLSSTISSSLPPSSWRHRSSRQFLPSAGHEEADNQHHADQRRDDRG